MKNRAMLVLVGLFIALATMGSSCLYDEYIVTANATVDESFPINAGPTTTGAGVQNNTIVDLLPESLSSGDIENISNYDLSVVSSGTYAGGQVSGGIAISSDGVNYTQYATLSTIPWDRLKTPQSVLGGSTYLTVTPAGRAALESALNAFKTNDQAKVWTRFSWSVSPGPVPSGLNVTVKLFSQVNFKVALK
jgi:hypothetical protein